MSALADRLRRLRDQAGGRIEAPSAALDSENRAAVATGAIDARCTDARGGGPVPAAGANIGADVPELKPLLRRHARKVRDNPPGTVVSAGAIGHPSTLALASRHALGSIEAMAANVPQGVEIASGLHEHIERLPLRPPAAWQWLPDLHPQLLPTDALLHFDTETTGLAGGTGTRAFMLGFACWTASGLEVRQLWIRRLAAESAMLERFAQWLSCGAFQLVSYNGRSFDGPLLRARYRLARQRDPLQQLPHHDLLHAVRRRFRREWPSCRLAEAEARLLGVQRLDDLPGAQVPAAFLDTLRGGDPRPLERVRRHHFQDLVSLACLLPALCELSACAPERWALA